MKILLSAIGCHPDLGSESQVGWAAVLALARDHDLWVLTHGHNREAVGQAQFAGTVPPNVRFIFQGEFKGWHPNPMIARLKSWTGYFRWSREIEPIARALHAEVGFDLAHHLTLASWRAPSPLCNLGIPFVWGPLGGAEIFPFRLYPILSRKSRIYETARKLSNLVAARSPGLRRCARKSAHIFAANWETEIMLRKLRGTDRGISRMSQAFFSEAHTARFEAPERPASTPDEPLRLFAGGGLDGRKGIWLALRALAEIAPEVPFLYTIAGIGPERSHLEELACQLGLGASVRFTENLRFPEYHAELGRTHIFLLPSLRESAGLTLMEAMLMGCVPIVADCGGPGSIVTPSCGVKVPVENADRMVASIAAAVRKLRHSPATLAAMGAEARARIVESFSERHYRATVHQTYQQVTSIHGTAN